MYFEDANFVAVGFHTHSIALIADAFHYVGRNQNMQVENG